MSAPRLLGVQIAHGFSSEANVFARLLAERGPQLDARVLLHREPGDADTYLKFGRLAQCEIVPYDSGWRPSSTQRPRSPDRVLVVSRYLWRMRRAVEMARVYRPDVVYSGQQHYDCRTASRISKSLGVPQIIHLHFTIGPWLQRPVLERLRTCDHVIAVSDFIRERAIAHGVAPDRVTTIRNTMSPLPDISAEERDRMRSRLGVDSGAVVIGMVGRLEDGKGHLDTIRAFERVAATVQGAWLIIVGTGHQREQIQAAASKSPAAARIVFTGQRSDVPSLLRAFDIFVHPATDDPCPLAVLEAMAASTPVVAYAQGGPKELIRPDISGVLVPHGSIDELANALRSLIDSPERRSVLRAGALSAIRNDFRPADAGRRFSETIATVLERSRSPAT